MAIAKVKFANMKACMAAHTILQYRCSALRLQRYWRGWAVKQQYKQLMIGMITFFHELSCSLPCTHLLTFAVFLYHNYSDITNMQARARRYLALTRFKALKHLVACVIRVQAWLRCGVAKWTFTAYRCKVLPLQALGRRVIARSRFLRTTRGKFQLGSWYGLLNLSLTFFSCMLAKFSCGNLPMSYEKVLGKEDGTCLKTQTGYCCCHHNSNHVARHRCTS